MGMTNKVFDGLKYTALFALPAIATLIGALTPIWDIPRGADIVLTITAVNAALGAMLGLSTKTHGRHAADNQEEEKVS